MQDSLEMLEEKINELVWSLENYDGVCCGMACNCYDNDKSDLQEAMAELDRRHMKMEMNNDVPSWVEIPADVDNAADSFFWKE